jgi:murein DD-endopeptidase MepM/ murein hydrolase activator NlpD
MKKFRSFKYLIVIIIVFILFPTLSIAYDGNDENPFSLSLRPSGFGENFIKVTGFLPENYDADYFALHIFGYENSYLVDQRTTPLRSLPEFNVEVKAHLSYSFTMDAYDYQKHLIIESEQLSDISGARYVGSQLIIPNMAGDKQPRPSVLQNGLDVIIDEIRCNQFPSIQTYLGIKRSGQFVENLTEQNFTLFEDGLAPSNGITVIPPATADGNFYLSFPLSDNNPYDAPISSVFDHSMTMPYHKDNVVVAYTGEIGDDKKYSTICDCYSRSDIQPFSVNGNYTGASSCGGAHYLCYDGHPGTDYAVINKTAVYAAADGIAYLPTSFPGVPNAQNFNTIEIDHQNGYKTYYLHLSSQVVSDGQSVSRGQLIGHSGDIGSPGAYHLHFEVQKNGIPVDPYGWKGSGTDPYALDNIDLWTYNGGSVRIADFAIVFDHSGSMENDLDRLRDAIGDFTTELLNSNIDYNLAFVPYEWSPQIKQDFTPDVSTFLSSIDDFLNNWPSGGTENAFKALDTANNSLSWRPGTQRVVLLFTDEDDDGGGPILSEINQILNNTNTTVYAVISDTFGHAQADFCASGSVTDATGGRCYDIFSPGGINNILDDITKIIAKKYIVKYETSNMDTGSGSREVLITVSEGGDQGSATKNYDPLYCNRVRIDLTKATMDLSGFPQREYKALPIEAKVVSQNALKSVTLFYRNAQSSYQSVTMADGGNGLYCAQIPSGTVIEPSVEYYIKATDGTVTVTYPSVNAADTPLVISVLPNIPPKITHIPHTSAQRNRDLKVSLTIEDYTNQIDTAMLHYRKKGANIWETESETINQQQIQFEGTIPGQYILPPGLEYYITATDNYGAKGYSGTSDNPYSIFVSGGRVPGNYVDVDRLRVWGDTITEVAQGEYEVSGNVKIGTIVGGTPLIGVSSAVQVNQNNSKLTSKGSTFVIALDVKRNPQKIEEDIPLWYGEFEGGGSTAQLAISSNAISQLRLIGPFLMPLSQGASISIHDNNTIVLHGWAVDLNQFHAFANLPDITLDQDGSNTTGKLVLNSQDFANLSKLIIGGSLNISDFLLELDFIQPAIKLRGAINIGQRIKLPKAPVLNIDTITPTFDFLLDPFYLDGFEVTAGLREPGFPNLGVLSFPQSPPSILGIAPTSMTVGVDDISQGIQNLKITGNLIGALVDTAMIDQTIKATAGYWPVSGKFWITIDLSGSIELGGKAELLEHFPLANARLLLQKQNNVFLCELSGKATLLSDAIDILIGSIELTCSLGNNNFTMSGNQRLTVKVPSGWWGDGPELANHEVAALIIGKKNEITKAEFSAGFGILWKTFVLRVDLINNDWGANIQGVTQSDGGSAYVTGDDIYRSYKFAQSKNSVMDVSKTVSVPSGEQVVTIRILSDKDAPFFNLTTPGGTTYHPQDNPPDPNSTNSDKVFFVRSLDTKSSYWALNQPDGGEYTLTITNENDIGNYEIRVLTQNTKPTIAITQPNTEVSANQGDRVTIAWQDEDPDDEAKISLFYDTNDKDFDGTLIVSDINEDDETDIYEWTIPTDIFGDIYIYARIDDGKLGPSYSYSQGYIHLPDPVAPSVPANILVTTGNGSAQFTWDLNDSLENVNIYRIYLENNGSIFEYLTGNPPFNMNNLANGVNYNLAMSAINENAVESEKSSWHPFTPSGNSLDGPSDLSFENIQYEVNASNEIVFTATIKNSSNYPAYGYKVGCWYGAKDKNHLVAMVPKSQLAASATHVIQCTLPISRIGDLCEANTMFFEIKEVILPELNTKNNNEVVTGVVEKLTNSISINLHTGWNLISLPFEPTNPSITNLFGPTINNVKSIWSYDGTWHLFDSQMPGLSDLTEIHASKGYYVFMDEGGEICSTGQGVSEIQLRKGWNLVGFPYNEGLVITDAMALIDGKYLSVWYFTGNAWKVYVPSSPGLSDLKTMEPGYGYWIKTKQNCTWTLP